MNQFNLSQISGAISKVSGIEKDAASKVHTRLRELVRAKCVEPDEAVSQGKTALFSKTATMALDLLAYYAGISRNPGELKKMAAIFNPSPRPNANGIRVFDPLTADPVDVLNDSLRGEEWVLDIFIVESVKRPRQLEYRGGYRKRDEPPKFAVELFSASAELREFRLIEQRTIYVSGRVRELFGVLEGEAD
tara:strand:+ start:756 stop:1328 length:573 start_codon:yes stop_codon:yes gene_type:complete